MNENINPFKIILGSFGCLFLFSLPIIAILAIWDFQPEKLTSSVASFFESSSDQGDHDFLIPAGEDDLLTSTIKNVGSDKSITPRSNPAVSLIIKSGNIEGSIVYGNDGEELLKQGFWNHPASVYPGERGVSVIFGHRRYHLPPAKDTFYNMDKVKKGDRIEIKLKDGSWLEYSVINTEVIDPDTLHDVINEQTDEFLVKFITCHPLGTSEKRLVITATKTF